MRATDRAKAEREARQEIQQGAGLPTTVIEIAQWDPSLTWAFSSRDGYITYDGLFQAPDRMQATETQLDRPDHPHTLEPSHHVFLGREVWEDNPNAPGPPPRREHCELAPEYVMAIPLNVLVTMDEPNAPPGSVPKPMGSITLRPGVRLSVEPGTATTVEGEPGTAYVWSPAEDPWLRADFVLDPKSQLRSAKVTDTARNEVLAEMSARPTDAVIQRPDRTDS